MIQSEAIGIIETLRSAYPRFIEISPSAPNAKGAVDNVATVWAEMFEDESVEVVGQAVKAFICTDTKGFPPHIGAIKEQIAKIHTQASGSQMTEVEAWSLVSAALRNGIYGAEEEYGRLPQILQRMVGSPSQLRIWAQLDESEVETVVASNFMRSYKARLGFEKEHLKMPESVKRLIAQMSERLALGTASPDKSPGAKLIELPEKRERKISFETGLAECRKAAGLEGCEPLSEEQKVKRRDELIVALQSMKD